MARTATEIGPTGLGQVGTTNFRIVSGIAKPLDLATLGVFQGLQRAINTSLSAMRSAQVPSVPSNIGTDGDIGPKTVFAAQFVAKQLGVRAPELPSFASSVNNLAINAAIFTNRLGTLVGFAPSTTADPARATTTVAPTIRPSTATPSTVTTIPPGAIVPTTTLPQPLAPPHSPGEKKGIHWAWFVVGGLALVGGTVLIFRLAKGGKKKKQLADSDSEDFDADDFGYGPAADDFIDV